jgi:hypothetical protein
VLPRSRADRRRGGMVKAVLFEEADLAIVSQEYRQPALVIARQRGDGGDADSGGHLIETGRARRC